MTDETQPDLRWAPLPPKPDNRKRVWLIVGLSVAALVIVGVILFLVLPRGEEPAPEPTTSASPSATPTPTATPTATPSQSPTATAAPEPPVQTEAPPVVDPTVSAFRDRVSGMLQDASRGLDLVAGASGQDGISVVDTLQQDTQRLADTPPPSSISSAWRDGLGTYSSALTDLRSALESGSGSSAALSASRSALQNLYDLVGL